MDVTLVVVVVGACLRAKLLICLSSDGLVVCLGWYIFWNVLKQRAALNVIG